MGPAYALRLRAGFMEDGLYVDIPLTSVEPLSLEINARAPASRTTHNVKGGLPHLGLHFTKPPVPAHGILLPGGGGEAEPLLLFRKTDGTLLSWGR